MTCLLLIVFNSNYRNFTILENLIFPVPSWKFEGVGISYLPGLFYILANFLLILATSKTLRIKKEYCIPFVSKKFKIDKIINHEKILLVLYKHQQMHMVIGEFNFKS